LFGIIVGTVYFLPPVSPARHCPHR
jgi:hypothetical protein